MHIKLSKKALLLFIAFICVTKIFSQTVWENSKAEVYPFLEHMANKGFIEFNDLIRPVSRNIIYNHLLELNAVKEKLSSTEKKELNFYLQEYASALTSNNDSTNILFLKKDKNNRLRTFAAEENKNTIRIEPLIGLGYISGSGKAVKQYNSGFELWGTVGKHWGYQFYFRDFNETGKGYDTLTQNTPATGIIRKNITNYNSLNYSETRGSITYSWKKGSLSFGQDHLLWGYGQNGLITLSDKSPVFPYLRFDYQPFSWLSFNYDHIWLNSGIIDSARTYPTGNTVYGGQRIYYQPKYMAIHSINIKLKKGLNIAAGESIIYNDKLQLPYFIPVLIYNIYAYESSNSNNLASSNSQFFFNIDSRNQLKKTRLYGTLFIDEISVTNFFNEKKKRNQLGYTIGIEKTDILLNYLTIGLEYTRVNPFVYRNFIPAEDYTNHNYYLGDWMGNNFDRWIFSAQYHLLPKLNITARYQYSRKGDAGTLNDQYFTQPQPPLLFGLQNKTGEFYFQCRYEWLHGLYINLSLQQQHIDNIPLATKNDVKTIQLGVSYGL